MILRLQAAIFTIGAIVLLPAARAQTALPDGEGKNLVTQVCTKCHGIETVTSHRFTKAQWGSEVDTMSSRGASATDAEFDTIVEYLAKNFGKEDAANTTSGNEENKLDVNTASASQLEQFLGIAASQAEAVVQRRKDNGKFKDLEDLEKVPGLDVGKVDEKKDRLTF
jgi:competence ComEA-like helix-hairpin-helix protein